MASSYKRELEGQSSDSFEAKVSLKHGREEFVTHNPVKRQKLDEDIDSSSTCNAIKSPATSHGECIHSLDKTKTKEDLPKFKVESKLLDYDSLIASCASSKQKFLAVFNSKLIVARQDFQKSYEQVRFTCVIE